MPLRLRLAEKDGAAERTFEQALGVGTKSTLAFPLPPGIDDRFEVWAGLHADPGREGQVSFEVKGNGARLLAHSGPLRGEAPARQLSAPLSGITSLQLTASSAGATAGETTPSGPSPA